MDSNVKCRPEIMYAEQERQHYDRLDEQDKAEQDAENYIDSCPDDIPDLVPDFMLADTLRTLRRFANSPALSEVFRAEWEALRRVAIDEVIANRSGR